MMSFPKKKILVTIPWFTPAYKAGGPVQSVLNMVNVVSNGLQFEIITGDDDVDGSKLTGIDRDQSVEFNDHTIVFYYSANHRRKGVTNKLIHSTANLIFINGIYSFYYNLLPLIFFKGKRIVVSARGMLHPPALQQKWLKKKLYLFMLKPLLKLKNAEFHATDETEARHIEALMGKSSKIWVAPNIPHFLEPQHTFKKSNELHLLTVALISPMKNHLKVLQALKEIKVKVIYDIVGPVFDADYWTACQNYISTLPENIEVRYHGAVPPNQLIPFYESAHVFICPSQSENFGHAFFEALSAGKPLITSRNTPWNQLQENQIGYNVNVDVVEMATAIRFFASMDNKEYTIWSRQAAEFSMQYEGVKQAETAYKKMFES